MSLQEALVYARRRLAEAGISSPEIEAEVLLRHATGLSRAELFACLDRHLTTGEASTAESLLDRRVRCEPLAYITGTREFFGLDFAVDSRVLVPRQETELLVEKALEFARSAPSSDLLMADVGTGSGAIAVSIACSLPGVTVFATDISADALAVAAMNCHTHEVSERVRLLEGDLLDPLPRPVDVIVANPPYVSQPVYAGLSTEVKMEPARALESGPDGLDVVRRLLGQASPHLRPGGRIAIEIAPEQSDTVCRLGSDALPGSRVSCERDLAGLPRVVVVDTA